MLEFIILLFSAVANMMLAFLVFVKNPKGRINKRFAFLTVSLVAWMTINYVSVHPFLFDQLLWIRLVMMCAAIMSMALLLLVNIFPTGKAYYAKLSKRVAVAGIFVALIALSPWVFTHLEGTGTAAQPKPGVGMVLFLPYAIGTLMLSVFILFRKFRAFQGVAREHIRYALVGVLSTFSLLAFFNFILIIIFHNTSYIIFSPALTLLFTASFAYGMVRHQLFDIRLIMARFLAYVLLLLCAGLLYGFATSALSFFIAGVRPNLVQIGISTTIVGIFILFVEPLHKLFNHITRTIFYQDDYDTKHILDELVSVLVRSSDTKTLANGSLRTLIGALKSEFIVILLVNDRETRTYKQIKIGQSSPDILSMHPETLLPHIVDTTLIGTGDNRADEFHQTMQGQDVAAVMRLKSKGDIVGYCFFGYKTTGSSYSQRDIDLIRIAGDEIAMAVQNTLRFEQIQEFNTTLQERIEEATKTLRNRNKQLQKLDVAKDEFVGMASHQLRTPLTSVKGYISMVLEGDAGKISAMQRQLLDEAYTGSERMVHLINDFLNVSRLQTGKFIIDQRPVDLAKVIKQEVESLKTTAHAHALKLEYRAPSYFPILAIDEGKIRQVMMNFIDNAIYYSPEHTTISVKLYIDEGDAVLEVHDSGIGVPLAEQDHLFTKFFRATNARKQRPDGTGVGLFLAKKVVVAHGGRITFESVEGEGSCFGFRLPIKKLSKSPKQLEK